MLSGLKTRIRNLFNRRDRRDNEVQHPTERPKHHTAPRPWSVKFWARADGRPFFGPVGIPSEDYAWVSRQTCRFRLRAIAFQGISQREPLWSRRNRRRYARAAAGLEYIHMMEDKTNMVENEKELLAVTA